MRIYDDIKKSIYSSLFYYNQKDREIRLLKSFIYTDLKLVVSILEDKPTKKTTKQQATEYYYGLYNILTQSAIQQYSNEYQAIVDKLPKPTELLIDRTKEVQDLEKQEKMMIEQFVIDMKVNPSYWSILRDMMPHLIDQDTLQIYTFFLGDKNIQNNKNQINVKNNKSKPNVKNVSSTNEKKIKIELDLIKHKKPKKEYDQTEIMENVGFIKLTDNDLDHTLSDTFYFSDKNIDIQNIAFRPLRPTETVTICFSTKELIQTTFQYKTSESLMNKFNFMSNKKQIPVLEKPTQEDIDSWPNRSQPNNFVQNNDINEEYNEINGEQYRQYPQTNVEQQDNINNEKTKNKNKKKKRKEEHYDEKEFSDDENDHKIAIVIATVVAIALGLITSTILVGPWF